MTDELSEEAAGSVGLRLAEVPRYSDTYHFHGLEQLKLRW